MANNESDITTVPLSYIAVHVILTNRSDKGNGPNLSSKTHPAPKEHHDGNERLVTVSIRSLGPNTIQK